MTDPDLHVAPTAAGTTSGPKGRAAAVGVFKAVPRGLVVWSNGSVLAEVRSVGRASRSLAMSVEMQPRNFPPDVAPVRLLGRAGVQSEVVIGSAEGRED
jgi:hypothetical protein